ncbi:hypothetical protein NKH77_47400 [Streptomyces sp. M19]
MRLRLRRVRGERRQGLTFATDTEPSCVDPAVSPLDVTALIDRNIFDSLVSASADGGIHPGWRGVGRSRRT